METTEIFCQRIISTGTAFGIRTEPSFCLWAASAKDFVGADE